MAEPLRFKKRVTLPDWDGELQAVQVARERNPVFLFGGMVWLMTMALGIVLQWYSTETKGWFVALADHAHGIAQTHTANQAAHASLWGEPVQVGSSHFDSLAPETSGTADSSVQAPAPQTNAEAERRQPADPAAALPSLPPAVADEGGESTTSLLSPEARIIAFDSYSQVDVVQWSGEKHLNIKSPGTRAGTSSETSSKLSEEFDDAELEEDLQQRGNRPPRNPRAPRVSVERDAASRPSRASSASVPAADVNRAAPTATFLAERERPNASIPNPSVSKRRPPESAVGPSTGPSCEAVQARYNEQVVIGKKNQSRDTPKAVYESILNRGSYFAHCGVPAHVAVSVCAAVRHGRAEGVTIGTRPSMSKLHGCVAKAVRSLRFPNNQRLDVVRTYFSAAE